MVLHSAFHVHEQVNKSIICGFHVHDLTGIRRGVFFYRWGAIYIHKRQQCRV